MTTAFNDEKPRGFRARFNGKDIGRAEMRQVPLDSIKIDSDYQRDTSRKWVADHLPFDEQRAGAIILSHRGGALYCIDGGHRLELARATGAIRINAYVIEGLDKQTEARLFTYYQRERRNLNSHDLFRADVASGDENTLAMVRIVTAAGFRLGGERRAGPNTITAIDACRYIQRYGGDDLLARTLDAVKSFWIGYDKALSGQMLKGLAVFLHSAGEQATFRRETFAKVMQDQVPVRILGLAQENATKRVSSSTSASDVAEALWFKYNQKATRELRLPALTISGTKRRVRAPRMAEVHETPHAARTRL
jgi:hypothetical protein